MGFDKKTKSNLKALKIEFINSRNTLASMKALERKIHSFVLENNEFYFSSEWEEFGHVGRITDPSIDYLMKQEDYDRYFDLIHDEWLKFNKLHIKNESLWKYEKAVKDSENKLLDFASTFTPQLKAILEDIKENFEYREKALEIVLKLSCD